MHHDVARDHGVDARLHRFAQIVRLLDAQAAGHGDGDVDEIAVSGAAHADALGREHALGRFHRFANAFDQARRRGVEQRIDRALAEPRADPEDDAGHAQRGERVGVGEPGRMQAIAQPDGGHAEENHQRAPDVSGEMKRVGFERVALVALGHAGEAPRARPVDGHGQAQNQDGSDARANMGLGEEQAAEGFPDDVDGSEEQQAGLDECGEIFDFSVAVGVNLVGRLVGNADGEIGEDGGNQVEAGVQRFREHAQAAGGGGQKHLQRNQHQCREDRAQRSQFLFPHSVRGFHRSKRL